MAAQTDRGIPLSALSPKFLHTNSTSHTWPFSAIAELIDNAYDPDVSAKQFWIDKTRIKGLDCLTFMDNGAGMNYDKMHKMLSFGFSDKQTLNGHIPVGLYGNGFKSGSMRLGKDAIVFSKTRDSMCVGLLSQSYLEAIRANHVIVPIVSFIRVGQNQFRAAPEHVASLQDILRYSLFKTESEIFSELRAINATCSTGSSGTRIIIWNLRRMSNGQPEFDFNVNRYDIQIPADVYESTSEKYKRQDRTMQSVPESDYSLRAYCSILYLKPRMQIVIRGQKVKTQLISKSLAYIAKDHYRPIFLNKRIRITFGYNTKSKEQYGIMMYHKNRLIKAYERVGCQLKANNRGVGVIGVIECNFLKPTHNKQDFDYTDEYRKTMNNLGLKLEEYWNEIRYKRDREEPNCTIPVEDTMKRPDQNWVQCDNCLKWRKLPDGIDCSLLPEKWFCHMNPDPQFRSCHVEEEPEDSDDDQPSYQKTYKQQERYNRMQQERNRQQLEQAKKKAEMQRIAALAQQNEALRRQHEDLKRQLKQSNFQVTMPRTQHPVSNNTRGPLGVTATSSSPHTSTVARAGHSSSTMPIISNVCSLSTPSRMKRTLSINPDSTEAKRVRLNGLHSNTAEAAEPKVPAEVRSSSPVIIPDDDDDDIVIVEASSTPRPGAPTFDLAKVKTEHKVSEEAMGMHMECSDDAAVETPAETSGVATTAAASSSPSPQQQVSTTTQTDPKPSVKDEDEEKRRKEKEKEDGEKEVETPAPEQRNTVQEEERTEGEVAAEEVEAVVVETVVVKEEKDREEEEENKEAEERSEEMEVESAAEEPKEPHPGGEEGQAEEQAAENDVGEREGEVQAGGAASATAEMKDRLLLEAQQQQDQLMELMQTVAQERDQYKAEVHQLTCQVVDLEKRIQELTEAIVKKEPYDPATEPERPEEEKKDLADNLSEQEIRRLYQQAKQEVEELKRERETQEAIKSESIQRKEEEMEKVRDDDELALQVDSLLRNLDQSHKERDVLQSKLEAVEMEREHFSSQCEQLKRELEELRRDSGRGEPNGACRDITEEGSSHAPDNSITEEATLNSNSHPCTEDGATNSDGIPSAEDGDSNRDGNPSAEDGDSNRDGNPSAEDGDSNRDGNPSAEDGDSNRDGNPSAEEGTSNRDNHPSVDEEMLNGAGNPSAEEGDSNRDSHPSVDTGTLNGAGNPSAEEKLVNESNKDSLEETTQNGTSRSTSPDETHRLRMLRQNIGRLLVTFVPALDLDQVNYDCSVIDEILDQVLDEVDSTGGT